MNSRERLLLITLIAVVGLGGFGMGTYMWFVKPLLAYNKAITTLRDEKDLEGLKWQTFEVERQKLVWARLKSLPIKPEDAISEYQNYLERMIQQTGLKPNGITSTAAVRVKPASQIPTIKEVGHFMISFSFGARGKLSDLVKFMELMQGTPYEHRIKVLNIDRVDPAMTETAATTLNITMTIETLLVAKSENKPGHPPGIDTKLLVYDYLAGRSGIAPMGWGVLGNLVALKKETPTPEDRQYDDIALKNVFVGLVPTPRPPVTQNPDTGPPPPPPPPQAAYPGNIPAYIRLVQTVPTHQEAYLLNLFYRNEEIKLSANPNTGYQVARIADAKGDYIFFFMKVLRVDTGVVYFQIEKNAFAIKLGQTLEDAIQDPISIERQDDLDLEIDREWAKEQMKTNEKEKTPSKKTGKKGG